MTKITKELVQASLIRAARTALQTILAGMAGKSIFNDIDWIYLAIFAGTSSLLSFLQGLQGLPEVTNE